MPARIREVKNMSLGSSAPELVREFLDRAAAAWATDVHFEPGADGLNVLFRLDGLLHPVESLPLAVRDSVIARLKVLGNLLTYRTDVPQEGRISTDHEFGCLVTDRRISVFPTIYGERAVVRFFYQTPETSQLDQLGFPPAVLSELQKLADTNQGVVLVTGPAGSGKTTTLYALIRLIRRTHPGKSIISLEDPVEQRIDGITQTEIGGSLTFPLALRSVLRQDPEVLMVGEIRDAETAQIAVQAGLTGHLVLTTVHSSSPVATLIRLLEMGIEPYQLTSSIVAALNQRLLRTLCQACGGSGKQDDATDEACKHCLGTGFRGRSAVAEIITMDGQLRQAVLDKSDQSSLEEILRQRGHLTIRQAARQLVADHRTTEDEILRVCGSTEPAG